MSDSFLAYCDESGQRDYGPKTDPYFVVAAVVAAATDVPHLEDELRGLKRTFWGNPEIELKSNWIRQPSERQKHYTIPHGIGPKDIEEFVGGMYRWLRKVPIVLLAGVVDKIQMQSKYTKPHYAGGVAYTMFLQRFQKLLAKRAATGSVVFDDPAGKSPGGHEWRTLLQRQHALLKKQGCPYTRTTFNAVGPLTLVDSRTSAFVQLADIVSYNTFRQFRDHGLAWEDASRKTLPLYEHFGTVASLFDRGPNGEFAGHGVAKWPVAKKIAWVYKGE